MCKARANASSLSKWLTEAGTKSFVAESLNQAAADINQYESFQSLTRT